MLGQGKYRSLPGCLRGGRLVPSGWVIPSGENQRAKPEGDLPLQEHVTQQQRARRHACGLPWRPPRASLTPLLHLAHARWEAVRREALFGGTSLTGNDIIAELLRGWLSEGSLGAAFLCGMQPGL